MLSAGYSALYYCEPAWVTPPLHDDAGRDAATAGIMLTVMIPSQVVAMPAVPALPGERRGTWAGLAVMTTLTAAGFLRLAYAPGAATWVWITALCSSAQHHPPSGHGTLTCTSSIGKVRVPA